MTKKLPKQYEWLLDINPLPKMVAEGLKLYGVTEVLGAKNNPEIMSWDDVAPIAGFNADSVPWCGYFMAIVARRAGYTPPDKPLWALNWNQFGVDGGQPELGDVLTFVRPGGGHVALYIAEDQFAYHVLGGNQGDQVNITRIEKTRMNRVRQPIYKIGKSPLWTARLVEASGKLSTNEA